ncbi:MAG TPA: tetratricopeptide repeat protein, partial [Blastocatellia bacterium]|nr:tetratricopeptide repeat protein [Blastocatellia bacterium]
NLVITLREKAETASPASEHRIISAAEFNQQVPAAARKEYEQAVKLAGKGKLEAAIERFHKALVIYPDYLMARNDLGAQYLKLKRLDEAAEHFHIALEKSPKYFHPRLNLGLVLIEQKNYVDAIAQLRQAIALDSTRPAARLWLGFALLQTDDLPGAERELTRALITGGAEFASAHYYLAQVYLKRGDSAEAARALRAYLEEARKGEHVEDARRLLKQLEAGNRPAPRQ